MRRIFCQLIGCALSVLTILLLFLEPQPPEES